jgi:hypothetical protein
MRLRVPSDEVQDRFWAKVKFDEDCWLWIAATRASDGIGVFGLEGKIHYAHRVAFVIVHGDIPENFDVRRSCGNKLCVRPRHLVLYPNGEHYEPDLVLTDEKWLM